jgi:hypothetical protein
MRRLYFDQFEFNPPESEQELELVISSSGQHRDLQALLSTCGASATSANPPAANWTRWQQVAEHLRSLAQLELPHQSQWHEITLLRDEWDELEIGIAVGPFIICYHWQTSA